MSVVDGMNVRLDSRLSAPIGYHGAVFENEAKNFSREGLVTGVGVSEVVLVDTRKSTLTCVGRRSNASQACTTASSSCRFPKEERT